MTKDEVRAALSKVTVVARMAYRHYKHVEDLIAHVIEGLLKCNTVAELKAHLDNKIDLQYDSVSGIALLISNEDVIGPLPNFNRIVDCKYPNSYQTDQEKMDYFLYCIHCEIQELE